MESKFKVGQLVKALYTVQQLKADRLYKVVESTVQWILGDGYTTVVIEDESGNKFQVGNPQVVLEIMRSR